MIISRKRMDHENVSIAVIPARGGSKRIPLKNIRSFCGLPIIGHTIRLLQESRLFEQIIVSTDNEQIADVARSFGAQVPFMRPAALADDFTGTAPVMSHATLNLIDAGLQVDSVCCVYATAALLSTNDLNDGYSKLQSPDVEYVFSASRFPSVVHRGFQIRKDGGIEMLFPDFCSARTQDLPETFFDAGQFYWGKPEAFIDQLPMFEHHSRIVPLPRWRSQDIDTEEDWEFAEYLWRFRMEEKIP